MPVRTRSERTGLKHRLAAETDRQDHEKEAVEKTRIAVLGTGMVDPGRLPGRHSVFVAVAAAGVNPIDVMTREGRACRRCGADEGNGPPRTMIGVIRPSALSRLSPRHLLEFLKFGVVGGSGVLVNMVVAIIMNKANGGTDNSQRILFNLFGTPWNFRFTSLVWLVSFIVANITNFQLNRSWTFKRDRRRGWWSEFWPFFSIGAIAALAGMFIKIALTNPTSPVYLSSGFFHGQTGLHAREYWAQIITIIITTPINFVVNKLWTFRAVHAPAPKPSNVNGV